MSRRRTFLATLLGCSVMIWNGSVWSQAAPAGAGTPTASLDAAGAVSNSTSLPPPAALPPGTIQALGNPPAPGLPPLPPAGAPAPPAMPALPPTSAQPGIPALPPSSSVLPAGPAAAPLQGEAAPLVTLPSLPTTAEVGAPVSPVYPPPVPPLPSPAVAFQGVPPVVLPPAPNVIEPAKEIAPGENAPILSTVSGGPLLPSIPNAETLALRRHPLPKLTPDSPLIPGPSLAETTNQRRQITTLPGSGGDTNYAFATIGGPDGPAGPLITPPTVLDTKPGYDIGKDYPPLQAVMPQPEATPLRWDEVASPFGTPNPPDALNYYLSKTLHQNPDRVSANPSPNNAEIIVLRGGQEFQGLILERGDMWRVELLNGTIITVPGNKVAHARKLLAVPTSTPTARRQVFKPQVLYREQMTN